MAIRRSRDGRVLLRSQRQGASLSWASLREKCAVIRAGWPASAAKAAQAFTTLPSGSGALCGQLGGIAALAALAAVQSAGIGSQSASAHGLLLASQGNTLLLHHVDLIIPRHLSFVRIEARRQVPSPPAAADPRRLTAAETRRAGCA